MDELRVVRRDEGALIVANDAGEEFRLLVDATALAELRHLARQSSGGARVNPRQIQALVRAGKSRSEITELTGADENDIERYEGPVLEERSFILTRAQGIAVRTSPAEQSEQRFGSVIAERLSSLGAERIEWTSWRDEEAGWMIGLEFESHDVAHRAVWSFDHRKGLLSPLTPDATTLSKQGEVGDRLIPKLRAVDDTERRGRFDSDAFDHELLSTEPEVGDRASDDASSSEDQPRPAFSAGAEAALKAGHPSTGSVPVIDADAEFQRRREIDQRAISTPEPELPELGQTADLLEALRRRRDERDHGEAPRTDDGDDRVPPSPVPLRAAPPADAQRGSVPAGRAEEDSEVDEATIPRPGAKPAAETDDRPKPKGDQGRRGKGRTSIPSWDDILFGTRGEGDD